MLLRSGVLSRMMQMVLLLSTMTITHVASFVHLGNSLVIPPSPSNVVSIFHSALLRQTPIRACSSRRRNQVKMQLDPNTLLGLDGSVFHLASTLSADSAARYFLAGGICCSISHGWTVPIDVVKTRIQTDLPLKGLSPVEAAKKIIEKDGVGGLFLGFGTTLVGYTTAGSFKYGLYEVFKPIAFDAVMGQKLLSFLLAGCAAEIVASAVLLPLEATRIRVVTDPSFANEVFDAVPKLIREKGLKNIYAGLPTMYTKMLPGTMAQLASYEVFAIQAYRLLNSYGMQTDSTSRFVISTACALLASVVSTVCSHPGDCLLSELNKAGAEDRPMLEVLQGMGFQELTAGFSTRLLHVVALVTTQLVFYDYAKVLVGLSFTGQ